MRSPQVADLIGEVTEPIGESPRRLDENAIGGWNQRARLAPCDVPNTRQISSLQHRQLRYGNIPEIHRGKITIGPVEARARFIDPLRRDDSRQRQLEKLVAPVLCSPVNPKLPRSHHIRLIANISAI